MISNGTRIKATDVLLCGGALAPEENGRELSFAWLGCQLALCRAVCWRPSCGQAPSPARSPRRGPCWGRLGTLPGGTTAERAWPGPSAAALRLPAAQPSEEILGRIGPVTAVISSFTLYCGVNLSAYGKMAANKDNSWESVGQLQAVML